jgi:hypothetical protein
MLSSVSITELADLPVCRVDADKAERIWGAALRGLRHSEFGAKTLTNQT